MKTFVEARKVLVAMLSSGAIWFGLSAQEAPVTWSVINSAEAPHPREEASFVGCGDRLYLLGGAAFSRSIAPSAIT